jgi:DNA-binding transcriptional regulator YhcF (GntR family)
VALLTVDPRDPTPIYAQLERGLRAAIATSRVRPGDQLPTVRQLAVDLRINANTVARVYAELERAGVFVTRMLADADAAGFTLDDVVGALSAQRPAPRDGRKGEA